MGSNPPRILAVNPGSRYCGIAVFNGSELRDWRIRSFARESSAAREPAFREMILRFIEIYDINTLAIKVVHPSRGSKALTKITRTMKDIAKEKKIAAREFSIGDIKEKLNPSQRTNKRQLMTELLERYPFLHREVECEEKAKNSYQIRMFEAVAVGSVCLGELDRG